MNTWDAFCEAWDHKLITMEQLMGAAPHFFQGEELEEILQECKELDEYWRERESTPCPISC